MFIGAYNLTLDESARLKLPKRIIDTIEQERFILTTGLDLSIFIYRCDEWIKLENLVKSLPTAKDDTRAFIRMFFAGAVEVELDNKGRIRLPQHLREHAQIEKDCVLIGVVNKMELWDPNRFKYYNEQYKSVNDDFMKQFNDENEPIAKALREFYLSNNNPIMEKNIGKNIFLCHSSKDNKFTEKLASDLTKHGITVWFDQWEMLPGDSLYEKIQNGIKYSSWFGIVLSPDSVSSNWCKRELHNALEEEINRKKIFVIPILYKDCEIPGFLKEKVWVDLRDENYVNEFNYLLRRFDIN